MEIIITKTFTKQYLRCQKNVQEDARKVITALENVNSVYDIKNLEKLAGFKFYYRIRIGQYRIGIKEQNPKVYVICIMERSQIYKSFPPKN